MADSFAYRTLVWCDDVGAIPAAGHKPLRPGRGATGMIGDPSGKSQEPAGRSPIAPCNQSNVSKSSSVASSSIFGQMPEPCRTELVNNYDWIEDFSSLTFCPYGGKAYHRKLYDGRILFRNVWTEKLATVFFIHEFTYQLLPRVRLLASVYETKTAKLQLGGFRPMGVTLQLSWTDPPLQTWGEVFALTCPLITIDGGVWKNRIRKYRADPRYTSPYKFLSVLAEWVMKMQNAISNIYFTA